MKTKPWKAFRTPLINCPVCKVKLDAVSNEDGDSPSTGDISACIRCGMILEFDKELKLVRASEETIEEFKTLAPEAWIKMVEIQKTINRIKN